VGTWLVSREFDPLASYLVPFDASVARAPPDPDPTHGSLARRTATRPPALIAWYGIIGGHSPDVCLGVLEDGDGCRAHGFWMPLLGVPLQSLRKEG